MRETLRVAVRSGELGEDVVERVLGFTRRHLGMDFACVTHLLDDGSQVVEAVDGAAEWFGASLGSSHCYELGARAVTGDVTAVVVADLGRDLRTPGLAIRTTVDIGAYVGAPLRLPDGRVYGMVSCFSRRPDPSLRERDAQFLNLVAEVLAPSILDHEQRRERDAAIGARVQAVLDTGGPSMAYQPIHALPSLRMIGYEALARFPSGHGGVEQWFTDAQDIGLGLDLELAAARAGLAALDKLPTDFVLAINVSAQAAISAPLIAAVNSHCGRRIIIEITEHTPVDDYAALQSAIRQLRAAGARIACDDAGSGYAGFRHLIELRPDIIKLDHQIMHHIDTDLARRAMAEALVSFARATDAAVLAEGVETAAELRVAADLGMTLAQGYHLGRPHPLPNSTAPVGTDNSAAAPATIQ